MRFTGKRQGRPPESRRISYNLNRLAIKKNIVDDQGNIFHFKNHAFRLLYEAQKTRVPYSIESLFNMP